MINSTCLPIGNQGDVKDYPRNLDVVYTDKIRSHFNNTSRKVHLRTTVNNANFVVKSVHHYTDKSFSLILCHITDGDINPSRREPKTHVLDIDFDFNDLKRMGGCSGNFTGSHDIVNVIIYNDDGSFKVDKRPKESGGGVIIEGP